MDRESTHQGLIHARTHIHRPSCSATQRNVQRRPTSNKGPASFSRQPRLTLMNTAGYLSWLSMTGKHI